MGKDFNTFDHFKGDFKTKPKEIQDHLDAFNYITGVDYECFSEYLSKTQIADIELPIGIEDSTFFEIECNHEPIDIGFMMPKIVCKKCDKDLPTNEQWKVSR
jgi:hypothetical protein